MTARSPAPSPGARPPGDLPRGAPQRPDGPSPVPRELLAEAAVWVARLHGPDRSRKMEQDFLAWQDRSEAHRRAFERCTDGWELASGVGVRDVLAAVAARERRRRRARRRALRWSLAALAGAALLGALTWGALRWEGGTVYATEVGEQRSVLLADGSRLTLNTATRLRVDLQPERRGVVIDAGEAMFEVAPDPLRPFVVRAGGSDVIALGTAFVVRVAGPASAGRVAVTLVEGRVSVQPAAGSHGDFDPVAMQPGERLSIDSADKARPRAAARVDRPPLEQALAWKKNEVVFEGATLADAVSEMNRYNRASLVLAGGPAVAGRRISGAYRTSDLRGFAHAVASLHGLPLKEKDGGFVIGGGD